MQNKNFRMTQSGGGGGGGPNQGVLEVISRPECSDPIDFSFLFLSSLEDAQDSNPRDSRNLKFNSESSKYRTTAVKLSNNILIDLAGFDTLFENIIEDPFTNLQSIDLSFNELTKIDASVIKYPNIKSLYLHGNAIENFNEIKKLKTMNNLRRLTLHGNPIDTLPQYRACVIHLLPGLKSFDFSGVTKNDRFVSNNINLKKKIKK